MQNVKSTEKMILMIKHYHPMIQSISKMPLYDGFEEDAYSDASTDVDDASETDSLSIRLKYSIRHAAIMLRWLLKKQQT